MGTRRTGGQTQEAVKLKGEWTIQIRDAKTEELIQEIKKKNVITTAGKTFLARMVASPCYSNTYGRCNWVMMLGTGTQTPSESDTGLFEPVVTTAKKGSLTYQNNSIQYYVRYMPEDANGYTYTEVGIYDGIAVWQDFDPTQDYTSGTLINHLLINPPIQKTSDILVDIYVVITYL